ncbi:unnamed protein product, partial [Amoebophrya sp. A120]
VYTAEEQQAKEAEAIKNQDTEVRGGNSFCFGAILPDDYWRDPVCQMRELREGEWESMCDSYKKFHSLWMHDLDTAASAISIVQLQALNKARDYAKQVKGWQDKKNLVKVDFSEVPVLQQKKAPRKGKSGSAGNSGRDMDEDQALSLRTRWSRSLERVQQRKAKFMAGFKNFKKWATVFNDCKEDYVQDLRSASQTFSRIFEKQQCGIPEDDSSGPSATAQGGTSAVEGGKKVEASVLNDLRKDAEEKKSEKFLALMKRIENKEMPSEHDPEALLGRWKQMERDNEQDIKERFRAKVLTPMKQQCQELLGGIAAATTDKKEARRKLRASRQSSSSSSFLEIEKESVVADLDTVPSSPGENTNENDAAAGGALPAPPSAPAQDPTGEGDGASPTPTGEVDEFSSGSGRSKAKNAVDKVAEEAKLTAIPEGVERGMAHVIKWQRYLLHNGVNFDQKETDVAPLGAEDPCEVVPPEATEVASDDDGDSSGSRGPTVRWSVRVLRDLQSASRKVFRNCCGKVVSSVQILMQNPTKSVDDVLGEHCATLEKEITKTRKTPAGLEEMERRFAEEVVKLSELEAKASEVMKSVDRSVAPEDEYTKLLSGGGDEEAERERRKAKRGNCALLRGELRLTYDLMSDVAGPLHRGAVKAIAFRKSPPKAVVLAYPSEVNER